MAGSGVIIIGVHVVGVAIALGSFSFHFCSGVSPSVMIITVITLLDEEFKKETQLVKLKKLSDASSSEKETGICGINN